MGYHLPQALPGFSDPSCRALRERPIATGSDDQWAQFDRGNGHASHTSGHGTVAATRMESRSSRERLEELDRFLRANFSQHAYWPDALADVWRIDQAGGRKSCILRRQQVRAPADSDDCCPSWSA